MAPTRTILFVCRHGSAKSVIAAEHCRRLAAQRALDIRADAAGVEPDAEIPPRVSAGLLEEAIDVRGRRPRPVTRADLTNAWRVVSFGCDLGDAAPPGLRVDRWDDVPAVSENFKVARDAIVTRVERLIDEC